MSYAFGDKVIQHLSRRYGLSRAKLAEGIKQPASVISLMCQGKRLRGEQARERVIGIINWFHEQGVLATQAEADALLEAAGLARLGSDSPVKGEERLIQMLSEDDSSQLPASRPTPMQSITYQTFISTSAAPAPVIFGTAPRLPRLFIGRDDDVRDLKQRLRIGQMGANQVQALTAMRGWPGVGKTTIAAVLAHDPEIALAFPDGVLWASLGQQPNVFGQLSVWGRALGIPMSNLRSIDEASTRLTAFLRDKQMLLIVDDVWEVTHAEPFRVAGNHCALLFTTRLTEVAQKIALPQAVYILGVLSEEHALELLRALAPEIVQKEPTASRKLVNALEGLPLALHVAGHLLHVEANYGFGVEQLLAEIHEGARLIEAQAPTERVEVSNETTPTVAALLKKSTDRLDPQTLNCFAYLGAFVSKPATFDADAMQSMWQTSDPRPTIRTLVDRGLLEPYGDQRFWMHALLIMHARSFLTD